MKLPESKLVKEQGKSIAREGNLNGVPVLANIELRYDDNCGNGHNSFAITAHVYENVNKNKRRIDSWGCCHDEIAAIAPDLAPYIKWHLCSSDMPMHYIANTTYLAGDKDYNGKRKGEPCRWEKYLYFENFPIQIEISGKMIEFLESKSKDDFNKLEVFKIEHPPEKDGYQFKPKFDFRPDVEKWYECAFDTEKAAKEFLAAIRTLNFKISTIAVDFSEGKKPELESARQTAIWPDATLKQLQSKEALKARLPALMNEFKLAMESLGFIY